MITIYHNPNCGTSRNTLAMIRQSGEEPIVIEYHRVFEPPDAALLTRGVSDYLTNRYSERKDAAPKTGAVNLRAM